MDFLDTNDSDVFAYGGQSLIREAHPDADAGGEKSAIAKLKAGGMSRWEICAAATVYGHGSSFGLVFLFFVL